MQYSVALPADYDMDVIRARVRTRGHLLDGLLGLLWKAYGIRERDRDSSPVNAYAPFYLWSDPGAMGDFLAGPGFGQVVRDFGRPQVRHWTGLGFLPGPGADGEPVAARRRVMRLAADRDPGAAIGEARAGAERLAGAAGVFGTALGLDPYTWELVHYTLWTVGAQEATADPAPAGAPDQWYRVLHFSRPGLAQRPTAER
ncbi:DUF4865 family protein [Streptomyces sp. NPDC059740]|uniref:DUF4865 family protein n=1 Tax=Streptomyces sp. NPDC059740 TaxID=3346926 RepID=UPI0036476AAF